MIRCQSFCDNSTNFALTDAFVGDANNEGQSVSEAHTPNEQIGRKILSFSLREEI
jgi:hypothetical protein